MSTPTRPAEDASSRRFPSVVVVSGGSAGNEILDAFVAHFEKVSFILPVSDNGGSSSEIIRWAFFQTGCPRLLAYFSGQSTGRTILG